MQKGFTLSLVLLVVLIITAIGGIVYLNKSPQKPTPSSPVDTSQSPQPTPDETANWKTYTNKKYGFSIKYPPSLMFISNGDFNVDFYDKNSGQTNASPKDIKMRISVNQNARNFDKIYAARENTIIEEEQHAKDAIFTKVRNINIDSNKAVEFTYDVSSDGNYTKGVIINHREDLIEISSWDQELDNFSQIPPTFKFLE